MRFSRLLLIFGFSVLCADIAFSRPLDDDTPQAYATVGAEKLADRTRVTFKWNLQQNIPFTINRHGNEVWLAFDKPVGINWKPIIHNTSSSIRDVETLNNNKTFILTLNTPQQVDGFLRYNGNGIDLLLSGAKKIRPQVQHASADYIAPSPHEHKKNPAGKRVAKMAPATQVTTLSSATPAAAVPERAASAVQATQPPVSTEPVITAAPTTVVTITVPSARSGETVPVPVAAEPNNAKSMAQLTPAAGMAKPRDTVPITASEGDDSPEADATSPNSSVSITAMPLVTQRDEDLARLSPAAGTAEPAITLPAATNPEREVFDLAIGPEDFFAGFIKQKSLWLVIKNPAHVSADDLQKLGSHYITAVQKLNNKNASIFVMPLGADVTVSFEKAPPDKTHMILQPAAATYKENLLPALHTNASKLPFLSIAATKADEVLTIRDPANEDDLNIIPLPEAGIGLSTARNFTGFNILPTAQGVLIQKTADDITVTAHQGVVEINSPRGLTITPEAAKRLEQSAIDAASDAGPVTLFPYSRWRLDDEKNFVPEQVKLFHDITYGTMEAANKARLRLAQIYLSEGLFVEAQGMANDILRVSYKFYRNNKVAAMRGATYFFNYRFLDAEREFSSPELAHDPEAQMWLSLCKELLGEKDIAKPFSFAGNYDHIIRTYPPVFIQKLAIIAADLNINRKEYDTALNIFEVLKKDGFDGPVDKYITYMRAKILSETKGIEEAEKIWEKQAANVDDSLIRARAEFSLVNLMLHEDIITPEEAIKRLERLRIVWRGDSLELNVLMLLGRLYMQQKEYSKALHTLRDIVLYFPEVPEAITTARQMEEIFVLLYNKGGADSMPPLEALSLFYEFRDLVPLGSDGDLMIRNLSDRLVTIDLLDRAALLLDHQVRKRLTGEERSRVGARLALIYLFNHQPKEALETLKMTGYGDLPADLQLTRQRLTAQALAQQNHADKAIEVLASDNSSEGNVLRLSIYWENKDWPNVVTSAEEILGNRNDPSAPLTNEESDVLLKLATAYVFEHDSGQIQYLRDYFTPLLKASPNKDSFQFITSESGTIDYDNLNNLDKDVKEVKTFLDTYRDKVKKNGLSGAI